MSPSRTGPATSGAGTYGRIYAAVSRIPKGRVATYGQVAALAGLPRQARLVGYALNVLPDGSPLPWHRVVNAQGRVSPRSSELGHEDLQRRLLAREDVRPIQGVIALDRYRWRAEGARPGVFSVGRRLIHSSKRNP